MKKTFTTILTLFVITIIGIGIAGMYKTTSNRKNQLPSVEKTLDPKNMSYVVNGELFALKNGKAFNTIDSSSITTNALQVFGEPVYGDLNGDGIRDAAVMLVNTPGGSGTFYYAVLVLSKNDTYLATNALLLGDRIAPQTITIENGRALYNYAERKAGEPMTTQPSMGKSFYVQYDTTTNTIGEWVKNFEGEADIRTMTLEMKQWEWIKIQMNDGKTVVPKKSGQFTLTFTPDKKVIIGTDCNKMSGTYTTKEGTLIFGPLTSTKMYCEDSQEQEFAKMVNEVVRYTFTSWGELILQTKMDSGVIVFR